jgi:hypothetical protein
MTRPSASTRGPGRSISGALGAAGLVSALLVITGCGGSSTPSVAHLGSGASAAAKSNAEAGGSAPVSNAEREQKMVAFAQCMRSHGVTDFPEPVEGRLEFRSNGGGGGLKPGSPQFDAAAKTCRKLLPNGGEPTPQERAQAQERALKFSACMRSHGVPNFPTPTFEGGGVRLALKASSGIDPRSPQFQVAQRACRSYFGPPGPRGAQGPPGATAQGGAPGGAQKGGGIAIAP